MHWSTRQTDMFFFFHIYVGGKKDLRVYKKKEKRGNKDKMFGLKLFSHEYVEYLLEKKTSRYDHARLKMRRSFSLKM